MGLPDSQWADLDGPVHWVDFGGPDHGPMLVALHGLGGSHVNWAAIAPYLTRTCRLVALDLPGFGLTTGRGRSTSVWADRRLVHRFVTEVIGAPAILVGNSMGGLISLHEAAEHPRDVAGLVLLDPALPPDLRRRPDPVTTAMFAVYATPGLGTLFVGQRRRVRTAEQSVADTLRWCCADAGRVPEDVVAAHVGLAQDRKTLPNLEAEYLLAARSLLWTLARRRALAATMSRIVAPVLLLHGDKDRLIPVSAARLVAREHPEWTYEEMTDVGHVPQLEVPERTADRILTWLAGTGSAAAYRAQISRATRAWSARPAARPAPTAPIAAPPHTP